MPTSESPWAKFTPPRESARESGMKIHQRTVADALASLKSGLAWLSEAEAQRRLVEFGTNEVEEVAHEALLLTFAKEFAHMTLDILGLGKASPFVFPKSRYRKKGSDGGMATRARFYGLLYRKSMENSSTK